jgi:hypothetical protein
MAGYIGGLAHASPRSPLPKVACSKFPGHVVSEAALLLQYGWRADSGTLPWSTPSRSLRDYPGTSGFWSISLIIIHWREL